MSWRNIQFEAGQDGVALLTINRPAKLNALNAETLGELNGAVEQVESDAGIRGLIVTGAGERAFVAGADISEFAGLTPSRALELASRGQRIFRRLETIGKPSIAAVNGFALGGGMELAMACTLRVASSNAKMGQPEVKLGIIAGYGGTQRLPRLVGRGRALEMLLTGEPVDAEKAERIGLVNYVVPQDQLLRFCRNLLQQILANAPVAVRMTMQAVDVGLGLSLDDGLRHEATAFAVASATDDCREGTQAFLEKRPAVFRGQ